MYIHNPYAVGVLKSLLFMHYPTVKLLLERVRAMKSVWNDRNEIERG